MFHQYITLPGPEWKELGSYLKCVFLVVKRELSQRHAQH